VIGVDPGLTGAIACLGDDLPAQVWDMPTLVLKSGRKDYDPDEIAALITQCVRSASTPVSLSIEAVHAMPTNGSIGSFSLGKGLGLVLGVAASLQLPVRKYAPRLWKSRLSLLNTEKSESCRLAAVVIPELASSFLRKKDHGRAEAVLLAAIGYVDQAAADVNSRLLLKIQPYLSVTAN
jgi:crossover junction endodeoxyribonuclease RuvC